VPAAIVAGPETGWAAVPPASPFGTRPTEGPRGYGPPVPGPPPTPPAYGPPGYGPPEYGPPGYGPPAGHGPPPGPPGYVGGWGAPPPAGPPRTRSPLPWILGGIGALLAIIVVAAAIGSGVNTNSRRTTTTRSSGSPNGATATPPTVDDHFHWAYGVYVCDSFLPPMRDVEDFGGIHTHQDGIIHIHPFDDVFAGDNATLDIFFEAVGMSITNNSISTTNPSTRATRTYQMCDGEPVTVQALIWDVDNPSAAPRKVQGDISAVQFGKDRQAITIALLPAGAEIPKPTSIPKLDDLSDIPPAPTTPTPGSTTPPTTAPGVSQAPATYSVDESNADGPVSARSTRLRVLLVAEVEGRNGWRVRGSGLGDDELALTMPGLPPRTAGASVIAGLPYTTRTGCADDFGVSIVEFATTDDATLWTTTDTATEGWVDGASTDMPALPTEARVRIRASGECDRATLSIRGVTGRFVYSLSGYLSDENDGVYVAETLAKVARMLDNAGRAG